MIFAILNQSPGGMSDGFWMALFSCIASVISAYFARKGNITSAKNRKTLEEVHGKVNGNLQAAINRAEDEARRRTAPRVLLVDDDTNDLELASRVLRRFGVDVFEARSAAEAERMLMDRIGPGRGFPFDFVLLDLKMPHGETETVFQIFNAKAPRIPIVILTGHPDVGISQAQGAVPRIWIMKPLEDYHVKSLLEQFSIPYHKPFEEDRSLPKPGTI